MNLEELYILRKLIIDGKMITLEEQEKLENAIIRKIKELEEENKK